MPALFDTTAFRVAEQGLNIFATGNKIIAQNIANADTPDYKAKYLYFNAVLKDISGKRSVTDHQKYQKKLDIATAVYTDKNTNDQPDGNNVDNDTQQALFVKYRLLHDLLQNQINSEFNLIKIAMRTT